jgi:hypothetical protein
MTGGKPHARVCRIDGVGVSGVGQRAAGERRGNGSEADAALYTPEDEENGGHVFFRVSIESVRDEAS